MRGVSPAPSFLRHSLIILMAVQSEQGWALQEPGSPGLSASGTERQEPRTHSVSSTDQSLGASISIPLMQPFLLFFSYQTLNQPQMVFSVTILHIPPLVQVFLKNDFHSCLELSLFLPSSPNSMHFSSQLRFPSPTSSPLTIVLIGPHGCHGW